MNEEQLKAEIERLEGQQKALENDWHAVRGAIAAYRQVLAAIQAPAPVEKKDESISTDNE